MAQLELKSAEFRREREQSWIELDRLVAKAEKKAVSSRSGMKLTRNTSPYHDAWIAQTERDLDAALEALSNADFERLAEIVEGSCLAMHADAMAARPGIIYFKSPTLWAIDKVRALRKNGTPVMFTIDAGPHVVAFTPPEHLKTVTAALSEHPEIDRVIESGMGDGASLTS